MRIDRSINRILESDLINEFLLSTDDKGNNNKDNLILELEKRIDNFSSDEFFDIIDFSMFNSTIRYYVTILGLEYFIITHEEAFKNKIIDIIIKEEYEALKGQK